MFDRMKTALAPWLTWFSTLSLPARFLIGAFVSAVGSAGAVGVITKLGAYWFVLYYGVRTPADGLPYVAETAAMLSVVVLTMAAFAYMLTNPLLAVIERRMSEKTRRSLFHLAGRLAIFVMLVEVTKTVWSSPETQFLAFFQSIAMWVVPTMVYVLVLSRRLGPTMGAVFISILTVLASFLLWYPPHYGWFLRIIGHGGGRYCTVHLSGEPLPRKIDGYLVVRTGTALLMFDGKEQTVEIPLEHVLRIEQPMKVYWCLPGNCGTMNVAPSR